MPIYTVIIIGSGFGGLCAALRLRKQGIENFLLLERREQMGGTWVQNSYPGAAVDVQSPLYNIEAEPYDWSQMFATQQELKAYTETVINKHQLQLKTLTQANVQKIEWQQDQHCWLLHVAGHGQLQAQFVINASGPLSTAVIPDFPGRDSFKGHSFHTNHWDHSIDYSGKKVAIIGSGASVAQVIPAIAPDVAQLHIFQRTPHWVLPRPDYVFKNWQRKLLRLPLFNRLLRSLIYWGLETRVIGFKYSAFMLELVAGRKARQHINSQIQDPELQKKVTPDFSFGCKRVILSNTLYPAYCRPNVHLHDKNDGVAQITATGIVTTLGQQLELDLIVYSTGFDATDGVISYPVRGRNGLTLQSVWQEFPRAYLGTTVPDFPNLFIVTGPNTGIGHTSAIVVIEAQLNYIIKAINEVQQRGMSSIEITAQAEERYTRFIHHEMKKTVWHKGGCNSWYKSKSGKVIAMFPGFSFTYRKCAGNFREDDHQFG